MSCQSRCTHGWSLIELMLAIALGLLLLTGLLQLAAVHTDEQRRLLLESRLTQDLRTAIELISRDVRRAGYWADVSGGAWDGTHPSATLSPNPYRGVVLNGPTAAPWIGYSYSRDLTEDNISGNQEKFGLRLNTSSQVIEWRLSGSAIAPDDRDSWQALTDPALARVTRLLIRIEEQRQSLLALCPLTTCNGQARCPPERVQRKVRVELDAQDARDSRVQRQLFTETRLRNDEVTGACPT
ncbi:PilW family protein [Sphaerotilus sp.]|uniref:PilW family protein n=1 Tax=Sphaerotilus sp. TaxID=2093942 RepID=UPI0034E265AE